MSLAVIFTSSLVFVDLYFIRFVLLGAPGNLGWQKQFFCWAGGGVPWREILAVGRVRGLGCEACRRTHTKLSDVTSRFTLARIDNGQ